MADQGIWFKLHCSAVDDPDLDNLDIADFGRWAKFGAYLKRHGNGGSVRLTAPARLLCGALQVHDFKALLQVLNKLPNIVIHEEQNPAVSSETVVTVSFSNWLKYQGDLSTVRVRKFRHMKRSRGEERRREEKREEEKRDNTETSYEVSSENPKASALGSPNGWAPSMLFIRDFLKEAPPLTHAELLDDNDWWVDVYDSINGFDLAFLRREFARMSAWLTENKQRRPIGKAKSVKRFVRGWLTRSKERERRYAKT